MRAVILLVEEDRLTRITICDMLMALDYRVFGVNSVARARRVMHALAIDAMIVTTKPSVSIEPAYAAEAKALQPNIKVVLVSPNAALQYLVPSVDAFVLKPFLLETLGNTLIAVLQKLH